jgi:hypothetical protein
MLPHSWSPVVSWETESCWERVWAFWRVILHGEAGVRDALPLEGSWLHSAVVDPGNNLCYLNCSGGWGRVDKTTTNGPL